MIGTILNVLGILIGGIAGLIRRRPLTPAMETNSRVLLGAFTVYYGLRLTWISINGSFGQVAKQIFIMLLALTFGRLAGHLLGLQKMSNRLGRTVREQMENARPDAPRRFGVGFRACTTLFCAAPLGIIGALQDGWSGYFYPLGVKAVMDGLATLGFVPLFGRGVLLSALPVLAFQGTLTLVAQQVLKPFLEAHQLVDSVNAAGGLMVFSVALVILGLKRIELTDYLPSLLFAPAITWLWNR